MKFFYEKFWVPIFGYILSKFVFLIEGKKQKSKNKKKIDWLFLLSKYHLIHNLSQYVLITTNDILLIYEHMHGWCIK